MALVGLDGFRVGTVSLPTVVTKTGPVLLQKKHITSRKRDSLGKQADLKLRLDSEGGRL